MSPAYDASSALGALFQDGQGYASGSGAAVATRTHAIINGPQPADSIDAVLRLAEGLPHLDDVREVGEHDDSDLTDTEQQQREQTESVITTALAAGDAALWVVAQGLDRAAKGRWWRRTHRSLGAYVEEKLGRSAVYGRQLRKNAPLALETARVTGSVPNPSHVKVTVRTEEEHGRQAAVALYAVVRDVSAELGARPTAADLMAVHKRLPSQLPAEPEQQRAVIDRTARQALIGTEETPAAPEPDTSASIELSHPDHDSEATPVGGEDSGHAEDDILDAEIVPEHLATLKDALHTLNRLNREVTRAVFAGAADSADAQEYAKLRADFLKTATALRNKALHAPTR